MLGLLARERELAWSLSNISDNNGLGVAITGMLVVFAALAFISLAIALLPRLLEVVEEFFPSPKAPEPAPSRAAKQKATSPDDAVLVAAIGLALIRASETD